MPLVWQDPEIALIHRGVPVYHTYKDDDIDNRSEYWFSFYVASETDDFDVRDLPSHGRTDHKNIIRMAIENGDLVVPEDCRPDCPHENLAVDEYKVTGAAASVELDRDAHTGEVFGFQTNRLDGVMEDVHFYCEDCGESFRWEEVKGF